MGSLGGPPAIRTRTHPEGIINVPPEHVRELRLANLLVTRTCRLLMAAAEGGSEFILENPADRGDPGVKYYFLNERHAPLWEMPEIKVLQDKTNAQQISFPMCELGHQSQKLTTLMCTPGVARHLAHLRKLECSHKAHKPAGGERVDGRFISATGAQYPAAMNAELAGAIAKVIDGGGAS